MRYTKDLFISKNVIDRINGYLNDEPENPDECLSEDDTISYSVRFDDGKEMDIKCCGVQYDENSSNLAWTEAVLFENGREICHTEPEDEFLGEWIMNADGNEYVAMIKVA